MLNQLKRISVISFLVFLWMFPLAVPGLDSVTGPVPSAHALSSKSMPLGSSIFVEIAKEKNPSVVNISIKGKSQLRSRGPERGPGPGQDPRQDPRFRGDPRDPFRIFMTGFLVSGSRLPNVAWGPVSSSARTA